MSSKLDVLTPQNSQVIFIDHQPQMAFGVQSIDRQVLKNNTVALAKAARVFGVPVTITTVMPRPCSAATASRDSWRTASARASAPTTSPSTRMCSTVAPASAHAWVCERGSAPCSLSR